MPWGQAGPIKPMNPTDAIQNPALRTRFTHFLDHTDPPATFRAQDVAKELNLAELKTMGYDTWEEVMPAVIELAFELRAFGYCQILKGGKVLREDVTAFDIEGGVRIRRID